MTWFKVDDSFHSHPKVLGLSDGAVALWLKAGTWAAQHLTDGRVPSTVLRALGYRDRHADELVRAGLWRVAGDGWTFHDWSGYQPSKAQVQASREARNAKQARWRAKARRDRDTGRFAVIEGGESP